MGFVDHDEVPRSRGQRVEDVILLDEVDRRDPHAVEQALQALTQGARGQGNLLELSVNAARAKATVGEISLALEMVFGRHKASIKAISGVYRREVGAANDMARHVESQIAAFRENEGRPPRVLLANRSAKAPAYLFQIDDAPLQRKCGFYEVFN